MSSPQATMDDAPARPGPIELTVVGVGRPPVHATLRVRSILKSDALVAKVASVVGAEPSAFWLVFEGRVVCGEWRVGTFGVRDGSRLHVVFKPRGGAPPAAKRRERSTPSPRDQRLDDARAVVELSRLATPRALRSPRISSTTRASNPSPSSGFIMEGPRTKRS
mmetsp:Transcript_22261/g.88356  ORF Transcript_22261/g.88356 Transcript_22261/m.88356 type:complete len:164 (+) Transcript_22261:42-533(+)